jgi:N-acetylglutamate synthase-like GNAT family acetyltransferase
VIVRDARAGELAGIGELRVAAYRAGGLLSANPGYAEVLRGLGISGTGEVLVAEDDGRIVGTVMLEPFHRFSEIARGPGEAEVRGLAVAPLEQHRGAGRALVAAVIDRATVKGSTAWCCRPTRRRRRNTCIASPGSRVCPSATGVPSPACCCSHSVSCFSTGVPRPSATARGEGTPRLPARGDRLQCHLHPLARRPLC